MSAATGTSPGRSTLVGDVARVVPPALEGVVGGLTSLWPRLSWSIVVGLSCLEIIGTVFASVQLVRESRIFFRSVALCGETIVDSPGA